MNKKSVPSQVFRGITLYEHVMKVKFLKVYSSDKCQQGDKNCFRYNKIRYFDPSKEDYGSRKICRHIIYELRSDKRDLLGIKVKSEIITEKESPSCCEQLQKI